MTKARLPEDPDLEFVEDAAAEAMEAVGHIVLTSNTSCEDDGHFLCWLVSCRHCRATLAPHVDAEDLRPEIARLRRAHACPQTPCAAPSDSRRRQPA